MHLFGLRMDTQPMIEKYGPHYQRLLWKELSFFKLIGALKERPDMYLMISKYIDVRQFIYYIDIYRYIPEIKMRIQLALNVSDLAEAVEYYSRLFGTRPHKRRPGYANFAIAEPPLKLVLFEQPDGADGDFHHLNHLGVEVER